MNTIHIHPADLPHFLPSELAASLAGAQRCVTTHDKAKTVWHVWGDASQPVVVLLHGGSGSWTHWVRNIAPLRDAGYRVLAPDLPGFGDSDLPEGCSDVDHLPEHLHAGLAQLQAGGVSENEVCLVGFSFGAIAGAMWLAQYPQDAEQLVLVGAPGMGLTVSDRVRLQGWRHLPTPEGQAQVHRHNLMVLMLQRPESLDGLALSLHSANVQRDRMPRRRLSSTDILAHTLPRIRARFSAIYGEYDALYRGRLPELQSAMPALSPNWGAWQTVAGAGHWVPYESDVAFNDALLKNLLF